MRPAADPAAQLVQLRQAEAVGVLDQHDRWRSARRSRPRSRWSPPGRPAPRRRRRASSRRDRRRAAGRGPGRCAGPAAPPAAGRTPPRRCAAVSASLSATSGTTTKVWRPAAASAARKASIFGSADGRGARCGSAPARRQLADGADRQVAVEGERQRARDGRGGQGQHVRLPRPRPSPAAPRAAPRRSDAARRRPPGRAGEVDRLADHRVGADHDLGLPGRDGVVDLAACAPPAASPRGTRRGRPARRAVAPGRGGAAAPGSRSAPSAPPASRPHGARQRDRGDGRLAAAHVALQQPAHRLGRRRGRPRSRRPPSLVAGQLEGQGRRSACELALTIGNDGRRPARAARACARVSWSASSSSKARRSSAAGTSAASSGKWAARSASSRHRQARHAPPAASGSSSTAGSFEHPRQQLADPILRPPARQPVDRHHPRGVDGGAADGREVRAR